MIIGALFLLAGLCEIGGGYLVWGWIRESKPLFWVLLGAVILAAYGIVAALQPISDHSSGRPSGLKEIPAGVEPATHLVVIRKG